MLDPVKVYFTKDISPEGLIRVYEALGRALPGKVGVKISTGEPGGHNYLKPEQEAFLRKLYDGLQTEDDKAQMESIFADFALPKKLA